MTKKKRIREGISFGPQVGNENAQIAFFITFDLLFLLSSLIGYLYSKYKMVETTNAVERLHGIRRKFAFKRINFEASYECRANIALLDSDLENWLELLFQKLNIPFITSF